MCLRVILTRQRGVAQSPRDLAHAEGRVGELLVGERQDELLRRTSRVATLSGGDGRRVDLLPPLYDVTLLWVAPQGFVLAGTERVVLPDGRALELSQAWWARTL